MSSSSVDWSPQQPSHSTFQHASYPTTPECSPIETRTNQGRDRTSEQFDSHARYAPYFSERTDPSKQQGSHFDDSELFGDMHGTNMAGFLQIKDIEGTVVKVPKVFTSDVLGIVDDWRAKYAVYPHTTSEGSTVEQSPMWRPKSVEKLTLPSGKEYEIEVPQPTEEQQKKQQILNEIGYRMSWQRRQEFCDSKSDPQQPRVMFLQRASKCCGSR